MAELHDIYTRAITKGLLNGNVSEERFKQMLQNDNERKAYFDYAQEHAPGFYSGDFDKFSQNAASLFANTTQTASVQPKANDEGIIQLTDEEANNPMGDNPNWRDRQQQQQTAGNSNVEQQQGLSEDDYRDLRLRMRVNNMQQQIENYQPHVEMPKQQSVIYKAQEAAIEHQATDPTAIANRMIRDASKEVGKIRAEEYAGQQEKLKGLDGISRVYLENNYAQHQDPYLTAASNLLLKAENRMKDTKKGEYKAGDITKNTIRHLTENLEGMASFGLSNLRDATVLKSVFEKVNTEDSLDNPESVLNDKELALYNAYISTLAAEFARADDTSAAATAGKITADMIQFVEEMALQGGLWGRVNAVAQKALARKLTEKIVQKASGKVMHGLAKAGTGLILNAAERGMTAGETAVTSLLLPRTYANMVGNQIDVADTNNAIQFDGYKLRIGDFEQNTTADAFLNAWRDQWKEMFTETGGLFRFGSNMVFRNPFVKEVFNKLGKTKFGSVLDGINNGMNKAFPKYAKTVAYDGVFNEWLEEVEGAGWDYLFGDKQAYSNFFSKEQQLPMIISFSLPALFGAGVNAAQEGYFRKKYDNAIAGLQTALYAQGYSTDDANETIATIKDNLYATDVQDLPRTIQQMAGSILGQDAVKARNRFLSRYEELSEKKELTKKEQEEFQALEHFMNNDKVQMMVDCLSQLVGAESALASVNRQTEKERSQSIERARQAEREYGQRPIGTNELGLTSSSRPNETAETDEVGATFPQSESEIQEQNYVPVDKGTANNPIPQERLDEIRTAIQSELDRRVFGDAPFEESEIITVADPSDKSRRGYIVRTDSGNTPTIVQSGETASFEEGDDIAYVRWEDTGKPDMKQLKDLDFVSRENAAQVAETMVTQRMLAEQGKQTFEAGQIVWYTDPKTGQTYDSRVVSVTDDGVEIEIEDENGNPNTLPVPHDVALTQIMTENPNAGVPSDEKSVEPITPSARYEGNTELQVDSQGNPTNENGELVLETVNSINDIADEDFENPTRNIELPPISQNVANAIGTQGRPIVIKRSTFIKNADNHPEFSPDDSRSILHKALYETNLYGSTQPIRRPYYRVAIKTEADGNAVVVLDVYQGKDNVEIVGWRKIDQKGLERMKRQSEREDGQLLILSPTNESGSAAALSALPSDNLSDRKGSDISSNTQITPDPITMSVDELAASSVEFMDGDKQTAKAYLQAELDKAKRTASALNKRKVERFNGIADFKAQNNQLNEQRKIANALVSKLESAIVAANSYKTEAERQAEEEEKARQADLRAQRRQTEEGKTGSTPAERWNNQPKAEGNSVTRTLPDGTKIKGRYVLAEAGVATPSHDPFNGWNTSDGFPVTEDGRNINDRDYLNDKDAQQITIQIAQTYDGQAVEQVPVVSSEGIVYDGNGRTIAGHIAAANNTDAAYLDALRENAANFGFTEEQLQQYQHPRVYMQVDEDLPYNTTTFKKFNAQEKKTTSSTNRAVANSKAINEAVRDNLLQIMDNYGTLDAFFGSEQGAADMVGMLVSEGVITQQEVAGLTEQTDKGFLLSNAGKDYITDIMLGALFDESTIRMLGTDKALKRAILRALPQIVENRRLGEYALSDNISGAIRLLYEASKADMTYWQYVRQVDAFEGMVSDRYSPFEILLAEEMQAGVEQFRQVLALYNKSAADEANGQGGLFEQRTADDIKQEILNYYGRQQSNQQTTAVAAAGTGKQERPASKETEPPVPSAQAGDGGQIDKNTQQHLQNSENNTIFAENNEEAQNNDNRRDVSAIPADESASRTTDTSRSGNAGETEGLGRNRQADRPRLPDSRASKSEQEKIIRDSARSNGTWYTGEQIAELLQRDGTKSERDLRTDIEYNVKELSSGKEADVYLTHNGNDVVKIIDYSVYSKTPTDFYRDRIELFNHLFPETAYTLLGFTDNADGKLCFIVSQPYIQGNLLENYWLATKGKIKYSELEPMLEKYMLDNFGMHKYGLDAYENDNFRIQDLHLKNVKIDDNGNIFIIDAIPSAKVAATDKTPLDVAKTTIEKQKQQAEHRKQVQEYINQIAGGKYETVLFNTSDYQNVLTTELKKKDYSDNAIVSAIQAVKNKLESLTGNDSMNGFFIGQQLFLNDDSGSFEALRSVYVHERQHGITQEHPEWIQEVMQQMSREELSQVVANLCNSTAYSNESHEVLADEYISMAMEKAYGVENNEELEQILQQAGANNSLINFIKQLNDEQRKESSLSRARRNADVNNHKQGSSGQNGRDPGTLPRGNLDEQGIRPAQQGTRGTESRGQGVKETQSDKSTIETLKTQRANYINSTIEELREEYGKDGSLIYTEADLRKDAEGLVDLNDESDLYMEAETILNELMGGKGDVASDEYERWWYREHIDRGAGIVPLSAIIVEIEKRQSAEEKYQHTKKTVGDDARFSIAQRDKEYKDAVEHGDIKKVQQMLQEEAERKGYKSVQDYKDAHRAPRAPIEKSDFTNLEVLRDVVEENGEDSNLFAVAQGISVQPDDYFSPMGARWYGYDDAEGMESYHNIRKAIDAIQEQLYEYGEVKDMPVIEVYRAVPKDIRGKQLESEGQWVSPSKKYAINHGRNRFGFNEYRIVKQEVPADQLWWDGNDIREWGFDDGTQNVYKNTTNNRKLSDVTYDENGELIPLSQRFNEKKSDVRFSVSDNRRNSVPSSVQREMDDIKAKAKADGTFMKAPNGEPTSLNERQWLQVRTRAFKNWFGDWEKTARIEKLRKSEPISITGDEIIVSDDIKQSKKNALEYGKKLQGYYINSNTGQTIQLQRGRSNGGIQEVLQHNYKDKEHLQSVAAIPQIIEQSIFVASHQNNDTDKNPDIAQYDHYVCGLQIGGVDYTVHALVAVDKQGNRYYDHNLIQIEKGKLLDEIQRATDIGDFGTTPDTKSTITNSGYKINQLKSILQTNSSKVVDENGEPMVVYHGTRADFTIFDRKKNNPTLDGFYFTDREELAKKFAGPKGSIGRYFLNMRNPNRDGFDGSGANMKKSEYRDGGIFIKRQTDRYAEKGTKEIIVFSPNQIKSATDNAGTFSTENDDIRFSIIGEKGASGIDKSEEVSTRIDNLRVARQMEHEGKDERAIRMATGWERGTDNKWRYEIEDLYIKPNISMEDSHYFLLQDLVDAPELFKAYPKLKDLQVIYSKDMSDDVAGTYIWQSNAIYLNYYYNVERRRIKKETELKKLESEYPALQELKRATDALFVDYSTEDEFESARQNYLQIEEKLKGTSEFARYAELQKDKWIEVAAGHENLLHEVQHAIQHIEGFAQGGNESTYNNYLNSLKEKHDAWSMIKEFNEKRKELGEDASQLDVYKAVRDEYMSEGMFGDGLIPSREVFDKGFNLWARGYDNEGYEDAYKEYQHLANKFGFGLDNNRYNQLSGEVEARNVQSRINLTPSERRERLLAETEDVAREDQIVLLNDFDKAMTEFPLQPNETKLEYAQRVARGRKAAIESRGLLNDEQKSIARAQLLSTEPIVAEVGIIKGRDGVSVQQAAREWADENLPTPLVYAKEVGDVVIDKTSIKSSLSHGYSQAKLDAIPTLPKGFENATYLGSLDDHNRPRTANHYFAYPIEYNNELSYVFCRAKEDNMKNRLYVHEVFVANKINNDTLQTEDSALPVNQNGGAVNKNSTAQTFDKLRGTALYRAILSDILSDRKGTIDFSNTQEPRFSVSNNNAPTSRRQSLVGEMLRNADELNEQLKTATLHNADGRHIDEIKTLQADYAAFMQAALKLMRKDLEGMRQLQGAQRLQKAYDKGTINALAAYAQMFIQSGWAEEATKTKLSRLLGAIRNGTTESDITSAVEKMFNLFTNTQLRKTKNIFKSLLKTPLHKLNISGVREQGKVDLRTQYVMQEIKSAIHDLTPDAIESRIAKLQDKLDNTQDDALRVQYEAQIDGLHIAESYNNTVRTLEDEAKNLKEELVDAKADKSVTGEAKQELIASVERAMLDNEQDLIVAYQQINGLVADILKNGKLRAKSFIEEQKSRQAEIRHFANSDLQGISPAEHITATRQQRIDNSVLVSGGLFSPLGSLNSMLKRLAPNALGGRGYLYNHFIYGVVEASSNEAVGLKQAFKELDEKTSEIWGKKGMTFAQAERATRKMQKIKAQVTDFGVDENGKSVRQTKDIELTQGQAAYIYMVNKMIDGEMKLRKMGISEEDIETLTSQLDPRLVELCDWIQNEFLTAKRNKYNAIHERLFGAPMSAIENYFPLRIMQTSRNAKEDVADNNAGKGQTTGTTTGAIKQRVRNSLPLDVLHSDVFSVLIDHLQEMEHWAAFAQITRDTNQLLSYNTFKRRLNNMSTVYGAGIELYQNLKKAFQLALGTYQPEQDKASAFTAQAAKGLSTGAISLRISTAIKQVLSHPAYWTELTDPRFLAEYAKNLIMPRRAVKWALKNLPLLEKRWHSRAAGDTRILDNEDNWRYWHNHVVEWATRIGMSPNGFIDMITCAQGAKAYYEMKVREYEQTGMSREDADKRAKLDAEIFYNETQQSSEGAFIAPIQKDRSWEAITFSLFNNSNFAYQRRAVEHLHQLKQQIIHKDNIMKMQTRIYERMYNMTEEDAKQKASKDFKHNVARNIIGMAIFGYIIQQIWRIGGNWFYMLWGDDDDEKKKIAEDASLGGSFATPVRGLIGGREIEVLLDAIRSGRNLTQNSSTPVGQAIGNILRDVQYEQWGQMINDIVDTAVGMGTGILPSTIVNMALGIYDAVHAHTDGDANNDLETLREIILAAGRVFSVPQSQLDKIYIDEFGCTGEELKNAFSSGNRKRMNALVERYIDYHNKRRLPLTGGHTFSEEQDDKLYDRNEKRFDRAIDARYDLHSPDE